MRNTSLRFSSGPGTFSDPDDDPDDEVIKWTLGIPVPVQGADLESLASGFRTLGVSVNSAVVQPVAVETREGMREKDLLGDAYDAEDDDWELLWLHVDDNWYYFDINLCSPIEMKPNSRVKPPVDPPSG
jgi:hypothetical protein